MTASANTYPDRNSQPPNQGYGARVPPCDVDAEHGALGAIFLAPDGEALEITSEIIAPSHFYRDAHGWIFQAMKDCHEAGTPLDNVTVAARLEEMGRLEDVGGVDALLEITKAVPHSAHIRYYAEIVERKYRLRGFIHETTSLAGKAYAHDADPDALAEE